MADQGTLPEGASCNLVANAVAQSGVDCQPCEWVVNLNFEPGQGSINYDDTFVQVGGGSKTTTTSPSLSIDAPEDEVTVACDRQSEKVLCVKGKVKCNGTNPLTYEVQCYKLTCRLCPTGTGE